MHAKRNRPLAVLCAGELLIDFISENFAESLEDASTFKRLQGGSPANLGMNLARLGNRVALAATVGHDDMGAFLWRAVEKSGVDTRLMRRVDRPSTLILVTRSKNVSNFEAYRSADICLHETQFSDEVLQQSTVFHTTCFALSQAPAQQVLLDAAKRAHAAGCQLSLDANYAAKIWPDQAQAQAIVASYCGLGALIKVSEVDWERLYGSPLQDPTAAAQHFLDLGASLVCVTLGGDGCFVATPQEGHFLPARPVEVKDTTGAGDAFWSGMLTAWLDGLDALSCAMAGRRMAEIKLGHFGPLSEPVNKDLLYAQMR